MIVCSFLGIHNVKYFQTAKGLVQKGFNLYRGLKLHTFIKTKMNLRRLIKIDNMFSRSMKSLFQVVCRSWPWALNKLFSNNGIHSIFAGFAVLFLYEGKYGVNFHNWVHPSYFDVCGSTLICLFGKQRLLLEELFVR